MPLLLSAPYYEVFYLLMLLESALIILSALLLDMLLGEPRRFHVLAGFGFCAHYLEKKFNKPGCNLQRFAGISALFILVFPPVAGLSLLLSNLDYPQLIEIFILYFVIGRKSLMLHTQAIIKPLQKGELALAREKISLIVSRDTSHMRQQDITKASIETLIENSNDAIFAAIFWFVLAGAPGALLYRLVNTLDAMWGYKNPHFQYFGWAAARLDDLLNWLPARLTVLGFALSARSFKLIRSSFTQGKQCASPNAGPVMSAGANALGIKLGGEAYYDGIKISKPVLGWGRDATISDIPRAQRLVNNNVIIWLAVICIGSLCYAILTEFFYA